MTVQCVVLAHIYADDLGAAQATGATQKQDCSIAQVIEQSGNHCESIVAQNCLLLYRWTSVHAFDACHDRGDVSVVMVERQAALGLTSGEAGQPTLDRQDRQGRGTASGGHEVGKVQSAHLRRLGQGGCALETTPAG